MGRRADAPAALLWHRVRRALRDPRRLRRLHHANVRAALRSVFEPSETSFLRGLSGADPATLRRLEADLHDDVEFTRAIEERHLEIRGEPLPALGASGNADPACRLLYLSTRLQRPSVVVETGVFDGIGTAFLLKALRDNGHGRLCSIDLPARRPVRASTDKMAFDVLPTVADPGWIVPDGLRTRWELRLGESRTVLGPWLAELAPIDLFFHDSLHTEANMTWEYETAWPALAAGGLLLSDDVFWSRDFQRFARRVGLPPRVFRGMGLLRKPGGRGATPGEERASG